MKRMMLILAFAVVVSFAVLAQETVYVSSKGSSGNSGLSEAEPVDFNTALMHVATKGITKIIILGTLDQNSNGIDKKIGALFFLNDKVGVDKRGAALEEIVITGKPGASGKERAVLSAKKSGTIPVMIGDSKFRFENIEISGAEGDESGFGVYINNNAQVTLGPGVVLRNNANYGIFVAAGGTCIIDGGEVSNNGGGVLVGGELFLQNGSIRNNRNSRTGGGGVYIFEGRFTMSDGTITGNRAPAGGGVYIGEAGLFVISGGSITKNTVSDFGGGVAIEKGGRFEQNGGTISGNFAMKSILSPNISKE